MFGFSTLNKGIHADVLEAKKSFDDAAFIFFYLVSEQSKVRGPFFEILLLWSNEMKLTVNSWCSVTQARVIISKSRAVGLNQGQHQSIAVCPSSLPLGVLYVCGLVYLRVTPVLGHWGVYLLGWWTRHAANGHGTCGMQVGANSGRLAGRAITHHRQPETNKKRHEKFTFQKK